MIRLNMIFGKAQLQGTLQLQLIPKINEEVITSERSLGLSLTQKTIWLCTREPPLTPNTKASGHQSKSFLFYGSVFIAISM
jgi:hypothetical protein